MVESSLDIPDLVSILSSFIVWILIYCPIIIYHLRRFQVREANIVYLLRYSNITVIQSILFMIKLIFGVFTMASGVYLFGHKSWEDKIVRAINAYLAAFFLYCFVWRFWLLRYHIMLNNIVINSEWKSIINHKQNIATKTFYAKYKRTFGNSRFTMWICFILSIVFTTMFVITDIVYPEFYGNSQDANPYLRELYAGWDYVIPFILLIIILHYTPDFEDHFYIRKEMKLIFICLCVQYAVYYSWLFAMYWMDPKEPQDDIIYCIEFHIVVVVQFIAMLISTFWVNMKCQDIIKSHRYQIYKISSKLQFNLHQKHCIQIQPKDHLPKAEKHSVDTFSNKRHNSISDTVSESPNDSFRDGLYDILSDTVFYYEFIKHLSKELSIECLLSLTEFVQFRVHVMKQMKKEKKEGIDVSGADPWTIELAVNIPQSWIVQNKEWNDKDKAYRLYTKYIKNGSDHEINISAEQRGKYELLFGNYDLFMKSTNITDLDLVNLFNPCCKEMIYLMIDSKKRFQDTPIYHKLDRIHGLR